MGKFVKNAKLVSRSYAIQLPIGSNSIGPQFPESGQVRYNSSISNVEVFYLGAWHSIGLAGKVDVVKDSFVGDGVTTEFVLSQKYAAGRETDLLVFVGNIFQDPQITYTVSINTASQGIITFASAPNFNIPVIVLHNLNSTVVQ